jgi:osmotically-inducible protein OsmY
MAITIKTDVDLQRDVLEELDWDPEVEASDVGIEVDDGIVTLTGTVEHYATKLAAERATFRVDGVRAVANDIQVRLPGSTERSDTDLAATAANVIEHNTTIPVGAIDIRVANHWVTLLGTVDWDYQRRAAEKAVKRIRGVAGVLNSIVVKQPVVSAHEIRDGIERALVRSAEIDANRINVEVEDGHVILTGTVRSWAERQEAHMAVWRSRGVTSLTNKIVIRQE